MDFENIQQIQQAFNLTEDNAEGLRKQLRNLQASLHPDKHGGDFASPIDKEMFIQIEDAIRFLDEKQHEQTALVPLSTVLELVKIIRDSSPPAYRASDELLSAQISSQIKEIKTQNIEQKITLTAVTTVLTAIWLFPSTIKDNPFLGYITADPMQKTLFTGLWLASLVATGLFWIKTWRGEDRQKRVYSSLRTENFQNQLFLEYYASSFGNGVRHQDVFTKAEFMYFLSSRNPMKPPSDMLLNIELDPELQQSLADVIFARAENNEVIKKVTKKGNLIEAYSWL